jgi:hypothetical protein
MGRQMRQNAVDFLLHSLEIYGALYLFYIALWCVCVCVEETHFVQEKRIYTLLHAKWVLKQSKKVENKK